MKFLTRIFYDMCLLAPATLHFNERGELVDFVTNDRYYAPTGKTSMRVRWSTPAHDYRDFAGLKITSVEEGVCIGVFPLPSRTHHHVLHIVSCLPAAGYLPLNSPSGYWQTAPMGTGCSAWDFRLMTP